MKTPPKNQLKA